MKKNLFIAICGMMLMSACDLKETMNLGSKKTVTESDNIITKTFTVNDFDELSVNSGIEILYVQKEGQPSVKVSAADNVISQMKIENDGDKLTVGFNNKVNVRYKKLDVVVTSPNLERIDINGAGKVVFSDGLKADELSCNVSGSGDIKGMDIECEDINTSISGCGNIVLANVKCKDVGVFIGGSGDITISGNAEKVKYSIAGSGNIWTKALYAKYADISIAGAGEVECNVSELKKSVAGSGNIKNYF
ncbi:MAG: head GIN domain-containing protein [Prevotellaceae bacterium]|nr:head GIN domain-containing protein [Prevotellaceae bacterium]